MKTLEGNLVSKGIKMGIVAARFNEFITSKLLGGARGRPAAARRAGGGHPCSVGAGGV